LTQYDNHQEEQNPLELLRERKDLTVRISRSNKATKDVGENDELGNSSRPVCLTPWDLPLCRQETNAGHIAAIDILGHIQLVERAKGPHRAAL
jgi:hypothetical protein